MGHSIHQRLLLAKDDFLSAVTGNDKTMAMFQRRWLSLQDDIGTATQMGDLTNETIALAHATASHIALLAEGFLDFHVKSEGLTSSFKSELHDIFTHVHSTEPGDTLDISSSTLRSDGQYLASDSSQYPPYIPAAYRWLIKNLYNPYPSNQIKRSISQSTGTSLMHINAWFMNVRRRMGWTALSKTFFGGSRSETVDAARRALVEEDPSLPSDVTIAFVELKYQARALYSDKLKKSVLAGKLDVVVKDMTGEDREKHEHIKTQVVNGGRKQRQAGKEVRKLGQAKQRVSPKSGEMARTSYPSPERSSYSSPEPMSSPSTQESEDDAMPQVSLTSCKRRIPPSSEPEESDSDVLTNYDRPSKRIRMTSFNIGLPSPQSSSEDLLDWWTSDSSDHTPEFISIAPPSLTVSRKRRLSDADASPTPKRPRGLAVGPRLQAVSDPLPMSTAITEASKFDSWFKGVFEMPDPVTAEELDPSVMVDIELFKNWSIIDDGHRVESSGIQKPSTPIPTQQMELLDSELQSVTPGAFDLSVLPAPFGDGQFNFEQTLDSLFNTSTSFGNSSCSTNDGSHLQTYCAPENATTLSPISQLDFLDFQTPNASDPEPTAFEVTMEEFLSSTPCQSPDSLPSIIPSFTPSPTGECVVDNTWSQFIAQTFPHPETPNDYSNDALLKETEALLNQIELPNVDPSLLTLSLSPPDKLDQNHEVPQLSPEKQAKLEKLRAHQEAIRKLEAELSI